MSPMMGWDTKTGFVDSSYMQLLGKSRCECRKLLLGTVIMKLLLGG